MTVNHDVTGSSPVGGAKNNRNSKRLLLIRMFCKQQRIADWEPILAKASHSLLVCAMPLLCTHLEMKPNLYCIITLTMINSRSD